MSGHGRSGEAGRGMARPSGASRGKAWRGRYGKVRCVGLRRGEQRQAWRGEAGPGKARHGGAGKSSFGAARLG
jgi:hypothetical protein